jgi:hypothetical protein
MEAYARRRVGSKQWLSQAALGQNWLGSELVLGLRRGWRGLKAGLGVLGMKGASRL